MMRKRAPQVVAFSSLDPQVVAIASLGYLQLAAAAAAVATRHLALLLPGLKESALCGFAAHCECTRLIQVWIVPRILRWNGSFGFFGRLLHL
jgi:hypothetical protein